jgi:hypothetical protein
MKQTNGSDSCWRSKYHILEDKNIKLEDNEHYNLRNKKIYILKNGKYTLKNKEREG